MEVRERAVRLVLEHTGEYPSQWAAITSIATKCGMTPETLRKWVRRAEIDAGARPGLTTARALRPRRSSSRRRVRGWRSTRQGQATSTATHTRRA